MKATINLLGMTILLSLFVLGCSKSEVENVAYMVEIVNEGTYVITDIELEMIGSDDKLVIQRLAAGETTGYQTFILPIAPDPMPDSWADFTGVYTQESIVKDLFILNYEHKFRKNIKIEITNSSYVIYYP
jgi:hypothetical protein